MATLKAFVAKSFHETDRVKTEAIEAHLNRFRVLGLLPESAERAEVEQVSKKVRDKIDACDIFVGIFTRKHRIYSENEGEPNGAPSEPRSWTAPPWVIQESGYALGKGKKLLLFLETNVEIPGLQGDLEYIPFDPEKPGESLGKATEAITSLISEALLLKIDVVTSMAASPPEENEEPLESMATREIKLETHPLRDMLAAAHSRDLNAFRAARQRGLQMIEQGKLEWSTIQFESVSEELAAKCGDGEAIQRLEELEIANPRAPEPKWVRGIILDEAGEYERAAELFLEAASLKPDPSSTTLAAIGSYNRAKRWDLAVRMAVECWISRFRAKRVLESSRSSF